MPTESNTNDGDPLWQLDLSCNEQTRVRYEWSFGQSESSDYESDTCISHQIKAHSTKKSRRHTDFIEFFAKAFERCISIGFVAIAIGLLFYTIVYAFAGAN